MRYLFTSEAVCYGHPDKLCDRISDYILDRALEVDKDSRMAVEVTIKGNTIFIYGEASSRADINYEKCALDVLEDTGYGRDFDVIVRVSLQSDEISSAVGGEKIKAGDQGIMFGYACLDTPEFMPMPISLANKLVYRLDSLKKNYDFLKPDGKCQITVLYDDDKVKRIDTIVMAVCHDKSKDISSIREFVIDEVIKAVIPEVLIDDKTKIFINSGSDFTIGGPSADSGTTGRKIVSDSYGGMARVGGGCFSSKDPTKVDRSGAYYARYVAKNIVANGLADKCEIQVSYAIGVNEEISLAIFCYGTNKVSMTDIYSYVYDNFNFEVDNIIKELDLRKPIYYNLACYGHFGRSDLDLSWEKVRKIL